MKLSLTALLALTLSAGLAFANPATQPAAAPAYPLTKDVVSGSALGDKPVVETIDGREVRFATAENAAAFKSGGEEMHKKMDEQIVAATKETYPVKTCLVSDEDLGDMGEPLVHVHRPTNQLVKFCCGGCVKKFKKNPENYLPKVAAAAAAK
jgi:hypothetical protein